MALADNHLKGSPRPTILSSLSVIRRSARFALDKSARLLQQITSMKKRCAAPKIPHDAVAIGRVLITCCLGLPAYACTTSKIGINRMSEMSQPYRILVAHLSHESNRQNPLVTGEELFVVERGHDIL